MSCLWYTDPSGESFYSGAREGNAMEGTYEVDGNTIFMHKQIEPYPAHYEDCSWPVDAKISFIADGSSLTITEVDCDDEEFKEMLSNLPVLKRRI